MKSSALSARPILSYRKKFGFIVVIPLIFIQIFGIFAISAIGMLELDQQLSPGRLFEAILVSLIMVCVSWVMYNFGFSPRIRLFDHRLVLDNPFSRVSIPVCAIEDISGLGGFKVKSKSGKKYSSVVFPDSLISLLMKYRTHHRAAAEVKFKISYLRPCEECHEVEYEKNFRANLIAFVFIFSAMLVTYSIIFFMN
ncbi:MULTISPECIES: hypothetical protein [unclassified Nocardiopsis]|uniref:hypothetical protein n=1 Tax=Nocardiopsis TaxID=2013 RepID=UPI00387B79BE